MKGIQKGHQTVVLCYKLVFMHRLYRISTSLKVYCDGLNCLMALHMIIMSDSLRLSVQCTIVICMVVHLCAVRQSVALSDPIS